MLKIKKFLSIGFILVGVLLYCFLFLFEKEKDVRIFKPIFNNFQVIIEHSKNENTSDFLEINNKNLPFLKIRNLLFFSSQNPIHSAVLYTKKILDKDTNLVIYNGSNLNYYSNFSSFKPNIKTVCNNSECNNFYSYNLLKSSDYFYNYNNHFNTFCIFLFGLFSGKLSYFLPYLLIYLGIFIGFCQKSIKLNSKVTFMLIFILALVFRINGFFESNLKYDDYYTLDIALSQSFFDIFKDPGNPPLLYIMYKILFLILPFKISIAKFFALLISILFLFICKYLSNKLIGKTYSNFFVFLIAINAHYIYRAFELRSYVLQSLLCFVLAYLLFKILASKKIKYLVFYCLVLIVATNLHYYMTLFILANFLFGIFVLISKKQNKKLFYFILLHIVPLVTFLPYLFMVGIKNGLLSNTFNLWINKADLNNITSCIYYLFGGCISLLIYVFYFAKSLLNKNFRFKTFVVYSFFVFLFVFLSAILISQYKSILTLRYFIFLIPLFLFNLILFFKNNKKHFIVFFVWFLLIQNYTINHIECRNLTPDLISNEIAVQYKLQNSNKNRFNIYSITKKHSILSSKLYNKLSNISDNIVNISINPDLENIYQIINSILNYDKNAIIYTVLLPVNKRNLNKYTCFYNSRYDLCLWKIEHKK